MTPRSGRPGPRPRRGGGARRPAHGTLRVVAGSARGLRLDAPAREATRPTTDRVRQATFNALESLGAVEGARVLDAYAGSGALGIEALSRGATHATFAETDAAARATVAANLATTGLAERASVVGGDGAAVAVRSGPWDLVLLDPPYEFDGWPDLLASVADVLVPHGVVVVESDRDVVLPASLVSVRVRRYGGTVVTFASPVGAPT